MLEDHNIFVFYAYIVTAILLTILIIISLIFYKKSKKIYNSIKDNDD